MKKTNKKLLLALGTLTTVAAPVAAVVSCGSDSSEVNHYNILPTYTGQADQLIALGIQSDYYPLQLNTQKPFDYLLNPAKYMTQQSDEFKGKFKAAVDYIMPKTQGVSWWNQDAKASDDHRVSNTYWQNQKGSVLLYEHYLLDDDQKVITESWAPKHTQKVTAETNFRASRDPYTRLPRGVFFGWDISNRVLSQIATETPITGDITQQPGGIDSEKTYDKLAEDTNKVPGAATSTDKKTVVITLDGKNVTIDKEAASIILAMRQKRAQFLTDGSGESDWFYNDWFFADSFHRMFLDNADFTGSTSKFAQWMLDSSAESPFTTSVDNVNGLDNDQTDKDIQQLFDASTYTTRELENGISGHSMSKGATLASPHHPIYEQQEGSIGAAPMFEGAMRDNQLYLFNVAWQVQNLATTGSPYGKQYVDNLPKAKTGKNAETADSQDAAAEVVRYIKANTTAAQYQEMSTALTNANVITDQLHTRMEKMNAYFTSLHVNGKKFGMMTVAPGHGVSTIQTMSKYSFIYKELGFAQPLPSNLDNMAKGAKEFTDAFTSTPGSWVTDKDHPYVPTDAEKAHGQVTNKYLDEDGKFNGDDASYKDAASAAAQTPANAIGKDSLFNMDDNGWFWTLGETANLKSSKLDLFKDQFDMGVIAARDDNYNSDIKGNKGIESSVANLFANASQKANFNNEDLSQGGARVNYDLWNEGIKTPFVMQMVLDQIMSVVDNYVLSKDTAYQAALTAGVEADIKSTKAAALLMATGTERTDAQNWGAYFTDTFTKNVAPDLDNK